MTKRQDDETPEPPGGRAAERLRQFEESRAKRDNDETTKPADECPEDQSDIYETVTKQDEKESGL